MSLWKPAGFNEGGGRAAGFDLSERRKDDPSRPPQEEVPPNNGSKPRLRPGPSFRSGLGQSPSLGAGPRPPLPRLQAPVLAASLPPPPSPSAPTLLPAELTTPPRVHLPQPLVAQPLSAPRGCPSAGNLTPATLPSQPAASALHAEPKTEGQAAGAATARWRLPAPAVATAEGPARDAGGRGRYSPGLRGGGGGARESSQGPRTRTHIARSNLPPTTSTQARGR